MKPEGERIAILETESSSHHTQIESLTDAVKAISVQLQEIAKTLERSKGFIAGISFAFSAAGAGMAYIVHYLWGHK